MLPDLDVLTLHCNLTDENRCIINKNTLAMMKPTAVIVNTARGGLIDENDLFQALKNGVIGGAAIDAWTNEPPAGSPLLSLKNVVAMPHCGALSEEALHNMDMMVTEQIFAFSKGVQPHPIAN
jgi:D-3-phosphoglycerate dehydrogenase